MKEYKVLYLDLDDDIEEELNEDAKDRWVLTHAIPPTAVKHRAVFIMERESWGEDTVHSRGNEPIPGEKLMGDR